MGDMIRIPVVAVMKTLADGTCVVDREKSEYADISADDFAKFLIRGFGGIPTLKEDL